MSDVSTAQKNALGNALLRNTAYTPPTTVYVALIMADGTTEATGGSYARQSVTFSAFASGATSNSGVVTFPTLTGTWGTGAVTYFQLFDALTAGNALSTIKALTTSFTPASGDVVRFSATTLTFTW